MSTQTDSHRADHARDGKISFVKWKGAKWREEVSHKPLWCTQNNYFVSFATGWATSNAKRSKQVLKERVEIFAAAVPRIISDEMIHVPWHSLNGAKRRLELNGDSKVVCNGLNGVWPVKNMFYVPRVSDCMVHLWTWMEKGLVMPRGNHLNWTRHVYREFNKEADCLAKRGKYLGELECHLQINAQTFLEMRYLRGTWDGGYFPGNISCGVGFVLQGCRGRPVKTKMDQHCDRFWKMLWRRCNGV